MNSFTLILRKTRMMYHRDKNLLRAETSATVVRSATIWGQKFCSASFEFSLSSTFSRGLPRFVYWNSLSRVELSEKKQSSEASKDLFFILHFWRHATVHISNMKISKLLIEHYIQWKIPIQINSIQIGKSQKQFFLKLHCPKRNIRQNYALWS